jgi:hypothetical protein
VTLLGELGLILPVILFGGVMGGSVQYILLQNIANGKWQTMSSRRKRGQILAGALGGLVAGLVFFSREASLQLTARQIILALLLQLAGGFSGLGVFELFNLLRGNNRGENV